MTATWTGVTSFSELRAAVLDGDQLIDVATTGIMFSSMMSVANGDTIEVSSTLSAVLDGGNATRLFRVNGDLTLRELTLAHGARSMSNCEDPYTVCGGGSVYVSATGSLALVGCTVRNNEAYVRSGVCARSIIRVITTL